MNQNVLSLPSQQVHADGTFCETETRREQRAARLENYIVRTVDAAPLLTAEQSDRLTLLLSTPAPARTAEAA